MSSLLAVVPAILLLGVLALYCRSCTSVLLHRAYVPAMGVLFIVAAFMALRVFNHLTMSVPFPLVDGHLSRIDQAMGLGWLGYAQWVAQHPAIIASFQLAYKGLTLVALLVFATLLIAAGPDRAGEFARLVFWGGLASAAIGGFSPLSQRWRATLRRNCRRCSERTRASITFPI